MRTSLYRHFNAAGDLLYVGISKNAVARMGGHKKESSWYYEIATVTIESYPELHLSSLPVAFSSQSLG